MEPGSLIQVQNTRKRKREARNWGELPRDIMIKIFLKVGVIDILFSAQSVCSSWRQVAREPQLYRCIDMWDPWKHFDKGNFILPVNMAFEAINRSSGQLIDFSIMHFGTDEVIQHIANTSCSLKRLRLGCCKVSDYTLMEALKRFPLLEEFALCLCSFYFPKQVIEVAGQLCSRLKYFRLNQRGRIWIYHPPELSEYDYRYQYRNYEALAIAGNMPHLRRLHLFGNGMTNIGLRAILDGCPQLEHLDLRHCFSLNLKADILKRCEEMRTLRLPNDSIDDYEFDATVWHVIV